MCMGLDVGICMGLDMVLLVLLVMGLGQDNTPVASRQICTDYSRADRRAGENTESCGSGRAEQRELLGGHLNG